MRGLLIAASLLFLLSATAHAQDAPRAAMPPVPAPAGAVMPAEVKEIAATGTAAIGVGGLIAARRAAEAQALRSAVERATGVFVSAHTLTQNYALVRDQVMTRAEGFATLKEVLREQDGPETVSVTVRALVSLRPLAERLKGLGLTRAWRVYVKPTGGGDSDGAATAALASVERALTDAGFPVVSDRQSADLEVTAAPEAKTTRDLPLDTAAGPMDLYSARGRLTLRATRAGTGEVVSALSAEGSAATTDRDAAESRALAEAADLAGPRLADALLILPARESQPVQLVVARVWRMGTVGKLEDALETLPGVRQVTRRSFDAATGRAIWELDVLSGALPLLARHLEADDALRPFHLAVASDAGATIVATAASSTAHP